MKRTWIRGSRKCLRRSLQNRKRATTILLQRVERGVLFQEIQKGENCENSEDKKIPIGVVVHRLGCCHNNVSNQSTRADCGEPPGRHPISVPRGKRQTSVG